LELREDSAGFATDTMGHTKNFFLQKSKSQRTIIAGAQAVDAE
jgi:hypothetical protein